MTELDFTHDAGAASWVPGADADGCDFPIQNLPFGVIRPAAGESLRGAVAIGQSVLDLAALARTGLVPGLAGEAIAACARPQLNAFLALGPQTWRAARQAIFLLLRADADAAVRDAVGACLLPQSEVQHGLPVAIGDYADFYTSVDHALNLARLYRPDAALNPNFKWMPCGYHSRASSLVLSGTAVRRPLGQFLRAGADVPAFGPCERLDYEQELGFYVGVGNAQGQAVPLSQAESHLFGVSLLNDWSARDIQRWESQPLGPFLAKNFATTLSPWIVTLEALKPFRCGLPRGPADPPQLPYLDDAANRAHGSLDIRLESLLHTTAARKHGLPAQRLATTSFRHQYWSAAQMLAHHTVGGCNLQPGDLIGSGTVSGPTRGEAGAMIELSRGGAEPIRLATGETRGFLADGDTVILRGWCEAPGRARIGFGECRGTVLPAPSSEARAG